MYSFVCFLSIAVGDTMNFGCESMTNGLQSDEINKPIAAVLRSQCYVSTNTEFEDSNHNYNPQ